MAAKKRSSSSASKASSTKIQRAWKSLNKEIVGCTRCPRLILHCAKTAEVKRRAYIDQEYWGKPVPNFVAPPIDPSSKTNKRNSSNRSLLIVGLAPGAHGANRTGRMFTGDRSGDWLYRALHRAGFANQPESTSLDDGLSLIDCVITAACHCAPPGNKPSTEEVANCQPHLTETINLCRPKVILALGKLAWDATIKQLKNNDQVRKILGISDQQFVGESRPPAFGHQQLWQFSNKCVLLASYHPSQQNTFTGKLTEAMLDAVMETAARFSKR